MRLAHPLHVLPSRHAAFLSVSTPTAEPRSSGIGLVPEDESSVARWELGEPSGTTLLCCEKLVGSTVISNPWC